MRISMNRLKTGQRGEVVQITVSKSLQKRLRDFGFIPGTPVSCRYFSPGGRVMAVEFRGTVIALRTADLKGIEVIC